MKKYLLQIIECNELTYIVKRNELENIVFINFIFEPNDIDEILELKNDEKLLEYIDLFDIDFDKLDANETIEEFCKYMELRNIFYREEKK